MHTHEICPPLLTHPGWHLLTHAHAHTVIETDAIHWSSGQPFTVPGEHGGTVPCSRAPQPWQGGELQPSVHQSMSGESGNWTANLQVIGRPTLTTEPRLPQFVWFRGCVLAGLVLMVSSTRMPQGTVVSLFLFTLCTSDFQYKSHPSSRNIQWLWVLSPGNWLPTSF